MKINNKKCKDLLEVLNIVEEKFGDDASIDLSENNVNININLKENNNVITARNVLTKKKNFNDYTWKEINKISKSGKAREYFNIGDEKEIVINEFKYKVYDRTEDKEIEMTHPKTTYNVQIIGFNHDSIDARGEQKVGITLLLKELLSIEYIMNSTDTNVGGWKKSEIRTFLNNDVYNALPSDLKQVIKIVNKHADVGNRDFWFCVEDRLFLLSNTELGLNPFHNIDTRDKQYEYFINNFRSKDGFFSLDNSWWLRSTYTKNDNNFFYIRNNGESHYDHANSRHNIVFAFCI